MAQDIYGRDVDLGDPISADAARITIPNCSDGLLVQSLQVNYQQDVTRLYELGSPKIYFVRGRSQGQVAMGKIVGATGPSKACILQYGDVCNIRNNNLGIDFSQGCSTTGGKSRIAMNGCVITSIAYSVSTPDMIVNENITMLFAYMPKL